jgi:TATA-binding protein-associated factor
MRLQAVKRVAAQHRLILSGTPIQNSVLELWALFDFLMPGFLGGQAAFHARFGKAVAASRGASLGSAEAQAGLLAMDGLHKQACYWACLVFWCLYASQLVDRKPSIHLP